MITCAWVQVYHKPAETFVSRTRLAVAKAEDLEAERAEEEDGNGGGDESTGAPSTSGEVWAPPEWSISEATDHEPDWSFDVRACGRHLVWRR